MVERLYRGLYRGKRIDNGEWVYGFYFCMYHDDDRKHLHHFIIPLNVSIPKDRPIGEIQVEVDPDTVGQCVSDLPDKNGKKIFEGDIVKYFRYGNHGDSRVAYVTYSCKDTAYQLSDGKTVCMNIGAWFYSDELEVIGNIHDNPELLEDKP